MIPSRAPAAVGSRRAPALEAPPEPVDLKHRLRRRVLDEPASWHRPGGEDGLLTDWLWQRWAPALGARGVDRSRLGDVVAGYRQELWLWLMGERTWAHIAEGLVGRTGRRVARAGPRGGTGGPDGGSEGGAGHPKP